MKSTFKMTHVALAVAWAFCAASAGASEASGASPALGSPIVVASVDDAGQIPPTMGALTGVYQPGEAPAWEVKTEHVTATDAARVATLATVVAAVSPEAQVSAVFENGEDLALHVLAAEDIGDIDGQWSLKKAVQSVSKVVSDVVRAPTVGADTIKKTITAAKAIIEQAAHATKVNLEHATHATEVNAKHGAAWVKRVVHKFYRSCDQGGGSVLTCKGPS